MILIDYIKNFLGEMSVKYRDTDNIYKYQYLYDTHIVEVCPKKLFDNSYYMEDELDFSMNVMQQYGESVLFVDSDSTMHVENPDFVVSCHDRKVVIEYKDGRVETIYEECFDLNSQHSFDLIDASFKMENDNIYFLKDESFDFSSLAA